MTIEELKAKKEQLEKDIKSLGTLFYEETGVTIKSIDIIKVDASRRCGSYFLTSIDVTIEL
jgi:hypothetical protein